jgi:hypothetical protein
MSGTLRNALLGGLSLLAVAVTVLGFVVSAGAKSDSVVVNRCGYTKAQYGRSAVYPWHMTCSQARRVIAASDDPHAVTVDLPGADGGAVAINGRFWVCTGQMGYYNCGYPWRPIALHGQVEYAGPFTEDVVYETCATYGPGGCGATTPFTQPPS